VQGTCLKTKTQTHTCRVTNRTVDTHTHSLHTIKAGQKKHSERKLYATCPTSDRYRELNP
jgi:hypothetical protein